MILALVYVGLTQSGSYDSSCPHNTENTNEDYKVRCYGQDLWTFMVSRDLEVRRTMGEMCQTVCHTKFKEG